MGGIRDDMEKITDYLRVFDGITQYANWGSGLEHFRHLAVVREEFPEKIWELAVHHTYFVHFHYGGVDPVLTRKYRKEWNDIFDFDPDSITVTNFTDKYENSHVLPSYESEDILMRIAQYHVARWRGEEFSSVANGRDGRPDLYVSNLISVLLGQPLRFEVIGFPTGEGDQSVTVALELCDAKGNVLHAFEDREMRLDRMRVEEYEVPSEEFYNHRAVHPRLRYRWEGEEHTTYLFPQTIATSIRPHLLYWTRSLKRVVMMEDEGRWKMGDRGPGETLHYPEFGQGVITSRMTPQSWAENPVPNNQRDIPRHGEHGQARVLRNSREIESWGEDWFRFGYSLNFSKTMAMPHPGGALDWYNIELENPYGEYGSRYLSPPIWVVSG